MEPNPDAAPFEGAVHVALVLVSILVGATTHIVWDSFTHPSFWPYQHWRFLSYTVLLPIAGSVQIYKLLQHGSTAFGMIVLLIWFVRHPSTSNSQNVANRRFNERIVFVFLPAIALTGGALRAFFGVGSPHGLHRMGMFTAEAVITTISLFWLELVILGLLRHRESSVAQNARLDAL